MNTLIRLHPAMASVMVAAGVAIVGLGLDWVLLPGRRDLMYSDMFAGLIAGLLSYAFIREYAKRERMLMARLHMVAEMNHHVRNALTPITLAVHLKKDREMLEVTQQAVSRIDWALRTVLSGDETGEPPPWPVGK